MPQTPAIPLIAGFTWEQALNALLRAIGVVDEQLNLTEHSPEALSKLLHGSGVVVEHAALINHLFPETEAQVGCLLELASGTWLPVLGSGEAVALLLAVDGTAQRPIAPEDLETVVTALVFREEAASMAKMLPFLRRHKGRFIEILLCGLVVNLFALCLPLFSSFTYDKILGNGIPDTLWALVIGLLIAMAVEFSVRVMRVMIAERFAVSSEADIDHTIFRNLLDARANTLPGIGAVLEKYKQIISYRDFLSSTYLLALADLPFLFLFLLTITIAAGPLVFVSIISGALMLISGAIFNVPVLDYDRTARRASERRVGLMTDLLTAREAVVGSAFRNVLSRRWRQASLASITASSFARYWRALGQTITGTISYFSYIGVLVGGVYMVEAHALTSGGLLAASMLTSRTMANFSSVNILIVRYREFRTALRELNTMFPDVGTQRPQQSHGQLHGEVRLEKVVCRLGHGGHPVLDGISLQIAPGEMVGIAGAPGSGKTTILRLIAGVLHPDEGQVLIDNIPLDRLSHEDLSDAIGFKPQDLCLFEGTIEENVRAGRAPLTAESRYMALAASGLLYAFRDSGLHWETEIGNRGTHLSGGQRQLVSLARALVHNPPLLLLDEPTNGLDAALENNLIAQLQARKGQNTIIVSSHSRNVLSICDRIIVVGQSRILANGPTSTVLV